MFAARKEAISICDILKRLAMTIPNHKEIATGTLRMIIKQSGLTVEEFRELLNK